MLAVTGGNPTASSAGNDNKLPPPAIALTMPAASAALPTSASCATSTRQPTSGAFRTESEKTFSLSLLRRGLHVDEWRLVVWRDPDLLPEVRPHRLYHRIDRYRAPEPRGLHHRLDDPHVF